MIKHFIFLFICISSFLFSKDNFYVCAIFHNEGRFLDEWVCFHLKQGADKIYLYNHQSTDDYKKVLYKYMITGKVILIDWNYDFVSHEDWNRVQVLSYRDCIQKVKGKCRWIAFLDTDEFLFSPSKVRVVDLLDSYNDCDQIGVNWVVYGTSNIKRLQPGEQLTQNMLLRDELHDPHVKSIVRPEKVKDIVNPHYCIMKEGSVTVNENKDPMEGPFSPHSSSILRINHYWLRDQDFMYNEKLQRQKKWLNRTIEDLIVDEKRQNQIYDSILHEWR